MHNSSAHFKSRQYLSLEHVQFLNACRLCSPHINSDECVARTRRFPSDTSKLTYVQFHKCLTSHRMKMQVFARLKPTL